MAYSRSFLKDTLYTDKGREADLNKWTSINGDDDDDDDDEDNDDTISP